ncbi:MAG: hypothetical protein A2Z34_10140 [Planctomycetes bacterium RBG_16_59_8]|nr:MAG: hypothetical protein A2Z34_10140 [Planctomycetes bacterium RBG_16_59_8]
MLVAPLLPARVESLFKWLFLFDTLAVTVVQWKIGNAGEGFYIAYFLAVLLSAASRSLAMAFVGAIVASLLYTWMTLAGGTGLTFLSMDFTIRLALFYVVSLFVGYMAEETAVARRIRSLMESRYRSLLEESGVGMLLLDEKRNVMEANRRTEELLGASVRSRLGDPLERALEGRMAAELSALLDRLDRASDFVEEIVVGEGDGAKILEVKSECHRADGRNYLQVFLRDVTHQRQIERHRMKMERLASMGRLTAGIAHELNNPLTSVLGYADLLRKKIYAGDGTALAEKIHTEAKRTARIVHQFVAFASEAPIEKKTTSINALCAKVAETWSGELRSSSVELTTALAEGLPEALVDPDRITGVLMNLIENGRDSIERTGKPGRIRLETTRREGGLRITVGDTGAGIPEELRDRLFEPFLTTKRAMRDTGMGLSVCFGIVHEHGGDITFESREGVGTSIHVDLPADAPHPRSEAKE